MSTSSSTTRATGTGGSARSPRPGALTWKLVGNTSGFGTIWPNGRFWAGYFSGVFRAYILFYQPGDGNWWLGTLSSSQISWKLVGNTSGFRTIKNLPFWTGFFKGFEGIDVLFYQPGDGNWWLGSISGGSMTWALAGNTGRSYAEPVRVHFKLLANPTVAVNTHYQAKGPVRGSRHPPRTRDDRGPDRAEDRAKRPARPRRRRLHLFAVAVLEHDG